LTQRPVQPELTFRAISHLLIVFLAIVLVVFTLVSMWKENRFGWPLRDIIWLTVAIVGSCAVIGLLVGYVQKSRSLEKVSAKHDPRSLENRSRLERDRRPIQRLEIAR
jgi:predicted ferric reductase